MMDATVHDETSYLADQDAIHACRFVLQSDKTLLPHIKARANGNLAALAAQPGPAQMITWTTRTMPSALGKMRPSHIKEE